MTLFPQDLTRSYNRTLLLVLGALLAGYALLLIIVSGVLRGHIREQIIAGEAGLVQSVTQWALERHNTRAAIEGDYMGMALNASEIEGVIGLSVYDRDGQLVGSVPATLLDLGFDGHLRETLLAGRAVGDFHPSVPLELMFDDEDFDSEPEPFLDLWVPLRESGSGEVRAFARYWMDGNPVVAQYEALDRNLAAQGVLVFSGGALLISFVVLLGFRRLRRLGEALAGRTRELEMLNDELAFAVKSSAVGAIAGHLVHELKNPLAALRSHLQQIGAPPEAREAANRMQRVVQEAVAVLRQQETNTTARYTVAEVLSLVRERVRAVADGHKVDCSAELAVDGTIGGREGNLIAFILSNLVQNAIEASPEGTSVTLAAVLEDGRVRFRVRDQGPGIDPSQHERIFAPGNSSKHHGSGIGLSISRLLARHLGGELILERSGAEGSTFTFSWPARDGIIACAATGRSS